MNEPEVTKGFVFIQYEDGLKRICHINVSWRTHIYLKSELYFQHKEIPRYPHFYNSENRQQQSSICSCIDVQILISFVEEMLNPLWCMEHVLGAFEVWKFLDSKMHHSADLDDFASMQWLNIIDSCYATFIVLAMSRRWIIITQLIQDHDRRSLKVRSSYVGVSAGVCFLLTPPLTGAHFTLQQTTSLITSY